MLNWEPIEHLSGLAPWYISDLLTDYNLVRLPRISQCAEEASAPMACSQLPADLRSVITVAEIKNRLKSFLILTCT